MFRNIIKNISSIEKCNLIYSGKEFKKFLNNETVSKKRSCGSIDIKDFNVDNDKFKLSQYVLSDTAYGTGGWNFDIKDIKPNHIKHFFNESLYKKRLLEYNISHNSTNVIFSFRKPLWDENGAYETIILGFEKI